MKLSESFHSSFAFPGSLRQALTSLPPASALLPDQLILPEGPLFSASPACYLLRSPTYSSSLSASTDLLPFSLPLIPSIPLLANLICCPLPRPLTPPRLPATTSLSLSISLSLTLSTAASYKTPPPHQQTYAKTPQTTHTRILPTSPNSQLALKLFSILSVSEVPVGLTSSSCFPSNTTPNTTTNAPLR